MSFLPDWHLEDWMQKGIEGGNPRLNPVSVDLTLGEGLRYCYENRDRLVHSHPETAIGDMYDGGEHVWVFSDGNARREDLETGVKETWFVLSPGQFALGTTAETVKFSPEYGGQVHGKSTLGRNGLMVHVTAGLIDPGFRGQITLELFNCSPNPLVLKVGQPICQLQVYRLEQPVTRPYNGHYQDQKGTTVPWT
jgi:dCTP deaminase